MDRARLTLPSQLAQAQARQLIEEIRALQKVEWLNTKPKAIAEVMAKIRAFFASLGHPTVPVKPIPPDGLPESAPLNEVFLAAADDMGRLFDQQGVASEVLRWHYNMAEGTRQALTARTKALAEKTKDYTLLAERSRGYAFSFQDSFTDTSHIDTSRTSAYHDAELGAFVLPLAESRLWSPSCKVIEIKTDPPYHLYGNIFVALPRNSREAVDPTRPVGKEDQWYWPASDDTHGVPEVMLDGSPDSWFEIQMLNFPFEEKLPTGTTRGYGLVFKDGTPAYYGSNGGRQTPPGMEDHAIARRHGHINNYVHRFTVTLVLELDKERPIDWISLTPYIPADSGVVLEVDNIETSVDNVNYVTIFTQPHDFGRRLGVGDEAGPGEITDPRKFDQGAAWAVPDGRKVRYIRLTLSCPRPYDCMVGHPFVELHYDVVTERSWLKSLFGRPRREVEHRVERRPSLEEAVDWQELNRHIAMPIPDLSGDLAAIGAAVGSLIPGVGSVVGAAVGWVVGKIVSLFSDKKTVENVRVESGLEVFPGWRWVVGIRDIGVWSRRYQTRAEIVSTPLEFPVDIAELSLSVLDFVPEAFYTSDLSQRYKAIRYYVSIDDGASWIPITPMEYQTLSTDNAPPKILNVEVNPTSEVPLPGKLYVRPERPVRRVRLRASMERPEGNEEVERLTPILYDWRLRAVPAQPLS